MFRIGISFAGGLFLTFLESFIVPYFNGNETIVFQQITPFFTVWMMNFFLLFTLLTHIKLWDDKRKEEGKKSYIS